MGGEIEGGGFQLCGGDAALGGKGFHAALEVVGPAGGVGMGAPGGLDLAVGVVAGEGGGEVSFVKGQAICSPTACGGTAGFPSLRHRHYFSLQPFIRRLNCSLPNTS